MPGYTRYVLTKNENLPPLRALAEKSENQGSMSQLRRLCSEQTAQENCSRIKENGFRSAEYLELAPHAELKTSTSLIRTPSAEGTP